MYISIAAIIIFVIALGGFWAIDKLEQYRSWSKANKPCEFEEWPHYRVQWEKEHKDGKQ